MKKVKFSKVKVSRIIKVTLFLAAFAVILFLLYPLYINIITTLRQEDILSKWGSQEAALSEEGATTTGLAGDSGTTSENTASEDSVKDGKTLEGSVSRDTADYGDIEIGFDIGREILDYSNLTAEDFFPLKIKIPRIKLERIVNEGADILTLTSGPGHIEGTPLPGDTGRCTISGHRTTYGSPFNRIDELLEGDLIYLETTESGTFIYAVSELEIVGPEDVYILEGTGKKELLLTSCHPEYSAAERIVLISELINIYPLKIASIEVK